MANVAQFPDRRQVEAEACAWIAQLDGGEPSPQDLAAFREWMHRSPQHQAEIKRLSALWGDLNILTELAVPTKRPRQPWTRFLSVKVAALGATALAGLVFVVFGLRSNIFEHNSDQNLLYATAVGEQRAVVLEDGSKLLLNTDSRARIDYGPGQRAVQLQKGEAYFEVAHNRERPFLVYAGANVIRAVGTAFSVHLRQRDVAVVVTEGTVELSAVDASAGGASTRAPSAQVVRLAALQAGQSATVDQQVQAIQTIQPAELTRRLSWREGVLSFSGEPLEQVVEEVSRYTPVTIVISDPTIRHVAIGGYFKAGETEAMFEALETSFGVRVTRVNDRLVYLAAK
jgi:transmembrane sensor